jgi:serine-type D-Ala-D-Ala carboxypeptidase (penicillin-binding protein 5/6)
MQLQYSRLHNHPYQKKSLKKRKLKLRSLTLTGALLAIAILSVPPLIKHIPRASVPQTEGASVALLPSRYDMSTVALPATGQSAIAVSEPNLNIHANGDQLWPMASITKVVTALAILNKSPLEQGQQGDTHTLNSRDEQYYWDYAAKLGTITPVTAGYEMTTYEILQTMLLASSNNMTDSLVDRYFDSYEQFVTYTNKMLENYGLVHTRVADASGFSPDSVSTPTEMIRIGQIALENPVIAEVVRQPSASPRVAGWIPNYNALINQPGVTGIKPGLTDQSGHNLLFSFEAQNASGETITVIAVVMGIFNRSEYTAALSNILDSSRSTAATQ